jgi:hypothetical protein
MTLAHIDTPAQSLTASVPIDHAAILRALNINVSDPKAQAMILACQKYGLDPLLKHAVLISGNLYVTRDGLLAIAHRSGLLDGIVIEDEGETAEEWWAKVTVHVKDVRYGYTYRGRYPKAGQMKKYGPEMAVKVAEVMALRRAFGVTGVPAVEEQWDVLPDDGPPLASPEQVARIDVLLPRVPQDAMPELKAWKADAGISMKAGEFTAEHADMVIAKLEQLATHSLPVEEPTTPTASAHGAGDGDDKGTDDGTREGVGETLTVPEDESTLKATNEAAYTKLNRYCRKVAADHFDPDKDTKAAQWEALAYACSAGRTTHLGELTPDEASDFRRRCQDVANGLARWVESDRPEHLGWTFDLTALDKEEVA